MSACASAFYAGFTAKFWLKNAARLSAEADVAGDFCYRSPPLASARRCFPFTLEDALKLKEVGYTGAEG